MIPTPDSVADDSSCATPSGVGPVDCLRASDVFRPPPVVGDQRAIPSTTRRWNSATTLFIARQLAVHSGGRPLAVLDVGCGDGAALELLSELGHDVYGYDLAARRQSLRSRLGPRLGSEFADRIRIAPDERTIPFADNSFDAIYANQVFEHLRFFDQIVSECARVLRPGGTLITLFPLATDPIEPHLRIPLAHWIPPGRVRRVYLWPFYATRLWPRRADETARHAALREDASLAEGMYYRFMNEVRAVILHYFESLEVATGGYLQAKIDLLRGDLTWGRRMLGAILAAINVPAAAWLMSNLLCTALVVRNPRK